MTHGRHGSTARINQTVAALAIAAATWGVVAPADLHAQTAPPAGPSAPGQRAALVPELAGRTVVDVRILGNRLVPSSELYNLIRTTVSTPLDPETVTEDAQRLYGLRKFANVTPRVEPTAGGVIVVFQVEEVDQVEDILIVGNQRLTDQAIRNVIDIEPGQSIESFRIALARQAIENLYRERNFPLVQVEVDRDTLTRSGDLIFRITEGPSVRIRNINFVGASSFTEDRLKKQIRSRTWIWVFRPGTFDIEQLEDDVASLRRYYQSKGFFDVRVGRKVIWSPDQSEVQIDFLIDEGPRYTVDRVTFRGNRNLSEQQLREKLNLLEGRPYDQEILDRDVRQIVRTYSPLGYIYYPQVRDPDYLQIDTKRLYSREPGRIELIYDIHEGKPFRLGRIIVKGNTRTQDKTVLREMRTAPGELYNSGELQDARDRIRATPYFQAVEMTPIGSDPEERDVLVEVAERQTASFLVGAGVNSNGGVGGNITYEQRNFDIADLPESWRDLTPNNSFIGAGQTFRISLEPGTQQTNASIRFYEPWLFDQPYSLMTEAYLRNREREDYDDDRYGGRIALGKRFNYQWSATVSLRAENVEITDIDDPEIRAPEILAAEGDNTLTAVGLTIRRDTTVGGFRPYRGTDTSIGIEQFGIFGGESFTKYSIGWNWYHTVGEDLLDRRTILSLRADAGYITGGAPFFERYYGGGLGSVRGFEYRGISPRSGLDEDRVGGDFIATATAEMSFPLAGESLRWVTFVDVGTVEPDFEINTIRSAVGIGIRMELPFFTNAPLALDLAYPITKDDQDDTQIISFSLGIMP